MNSGKAVKDDAVRSSWGSDMSFDEDPTQKLHSGPKQSQHQHHENKNSIIRESDATKQHPEQSKPSMGQQPLKPSSVTFPSQFSRESSVDRDEDRECDGGSEKEKKAGSINQNQSSQTAQLTRRLSVQDRINLFENKQKETIGSGGKPVGKSAELRRMSSDVSSVPTVVEKAVLRRWSGASDMSIDLSGEKKDIESPLCTPSSSSVSQTKSEEQKALNDTPASGKLELKNDISRVGGSGSAYRIDPQILVGVVSGQEEVVKTKVGLNAGTLFTASSSYSEDASGSNKMTSTMGKVESDGGQDQTSVRTQNQSRSFSRDEDESLKGQIKSQIQLRSLPGVRE